MNYKTFILVLTAVAISLSFFTLPIILENIKNDPEIEAMANNPQQTRDVFSKCKTKVDDEHLCYEAYSAAVKLANKSGCSVDTINLRFSFKQLVEHASDQDIAQNLIKDCPAEADYIRKNHLFD